MNGEGCLITFEGIEGAGKGVQVARLVARLRSKGVVVKVAREPGGSLLGEACRGLVLRSDIYPSEHAELLLMMAARAQLFHELVRPALAAGEWVVLDRSLDSSVAYQGYGRGMSLAFIDHLHREVLGSTMPACTFLLDLPVSEMSTRLAMRGATPDRIEQLDEAFFERVRGGYLQQAALHPERFCTIDASLPVGMIEQAIWRQTAMLLPLPT